MNYTEKQMDLFSVEEEYMLAHCISRDAKMGAGIAKIFVQKFPELKVLRQDWENKNEVGTCKQIGRVFNLITKERFWDKPTYETMEEALIELKELCRRNRVKKLAMPLIGCGLDKLEWDEVSRMVQEIFEELDIDILVCIQ